jgi:DNA-binding CsgD family transcriptional regulator
LHAETEPAREFSLALKVRMRNARGGWEPLCCVLTSLVGDDDRCFILVEAPETVSSADRTAELEHYLWKIAGEVEASGILERIGIPPDPERLPEMNSLTVRQWEVLTRLRRGERVPTIADELFLSQSAVRNHLSEIFKRFGVHSQPELMALFTRTDASSS